MLTKEEFQRLKDERIAIIGKLQFEKNLSSSSTISEHDNLLNMIDIKLNVKNIKPSTDNSFNFPETPDGMKPFLKQQLDQIEQLPSGKELLNQISRYYKKKDQSLELTFTNDNNIPSQVRFDKYGEIKGIDINLWKDSVTDPTTSKGGIQNVFHIDHLIKSKANLSSGIEVVEIGKGLTPSYLGLAHELIHALHLIKKSALTLRNAEKTPDQSISLKGSSLWTNEEERQTVINPLEISELTLRREAREPLRYIYQGLYDYKSQKSTPTFFDTIDAVRANIIPKNNLLSNPTWDANKDYVDRLIRYLPVKSIPPLMGMEQKDQVETIMGIQRHIPLKLMPGLFEKLYPEKTDNALKDREIISIMFPKLGDNSIKSPGRMILETLDANKSKFPSLLNKSQASIQKTTGKLSQNDGQLTGYLKKKLQSIEQKIKTLKQDNDNYYKLSEFKELTNKLERNRERKLDINNYKTQLAIKLHQEEENHKDLQEASKYSGILSQQRASYPNWFTQENKDKWRFLQLLDAVDIRKTSSNSIFDASSEHSSRSSSSSFFPSSDSPSASSSTSFGSSSSSVPTAPLVAQTQATHLEPLMRVDSNVSTQKPTAQMLVPSGQSEAKPRTVVPLVPATQSTSSSSSTTTSSVNMTSTFIPPGESYVPEPSRTIFAQQGQMRQQLSATQASMQQLSPVHPVAQQQSISPSFPQLGSVGYMGASSRAAMPSAQPSMPPSQVQAQPVMPPQASMQRSSVLVPTPTQASTPEISAPLFNPLPAGSSSTLMPLLTQTPRPISPTQTTAPIFSVKGITSAPWYLSMISRLG